LTFPLLLLLLSSPLPQQEPAPVPTQPQEPAVLVPPPAAAQDPDGLDAGFGFESADGSFRLRFKGKLDNDWAFFSADPDVAAASDRFDNGTEFRRARVGLSGRLHDWLKFKATFDFSDDASGFRDIYLEPRKVGGLDTLRVGHFKEPFGLENLTGSSAITLMERGLPTALAPGRNMGLMARDRFLDKRATWAVGAFRETDSTGIGTDSDAGQEFAVTARLTGLPWYQDKGRRLAHLGLSFSHRNPDDGEVRFRESPESHLAPNLVTTGTFLADTVQLAMLEGAVVHGPWSLQAELAQAAVTTPGGNDPAFRSMTVMTSCFVTGESRVYDREVGAFDPVLPCSPFLGGDGSGAWEVAARYSELDLNDSGIPGGELRDLSLGVNWYLDANTRFQLNYVIADLETFGNARILQFRFHVHW